MGEFEEVIPGITEDATAFHLYRWGHAFSVPGKGWVFSAARQSLQEPLGRLVGCDGREVHELIVLRLRILDRGAGYRGAEGIGAVGGMEGFGRHAHRSSRPEPRV
jgi:hypothetical protein